MTRLAAPSALETIVELDRLLGDPRLDSSAIAFERALEQDGRSGFPGDEVAVLDEAGVQRHYVPRVHGGELSDLFVPLQLMRQVARRDVTVAVAHGKTFLGAVCAWVAGGEAGERMSAIVTVGDPVSWGLTEPGRGSDLGDSATAARLGDAGIVVDGVKWPINNATRGRAMTVLARTGDRPGPRALSLVLVDKQLVDRSTISYLPKTRTHGIRGADISGIEFAATRTAADSLIGAPGSGLEIVLKALQLTRPLCSALSLGAGDQALEIALEFARTRTMFGRTLGGLPAAGATLGGSVADFLLAEAVAFTGIRHLHTSPEEMALESAFVKFLVPDSMDLLFRELTSFLGARSQLVGIGGAGRFQKAARDNRVVGIFDGNSVVNLNVVINEFPNLLRPSEPTEPGPVVAALRYPPAATGLEPERLRLVTRRGSTLLRAFPALVETIDDGRTPAAAIASARALLVELERALDEVRAAERAPHPPAAQYLLAERLALLFGAAASVALFAANRGAPMTPLWEDGLWLRAVLDRVSHRLGLLAEGERTESAVELAARASASSATGDPVTLLPGWWAPELRHD